jgi:hypothetical protein
VSLHSTLSSAVPPPTTSTPGCRATPNHPDTLTGPASHPHPRRHPTEALRRHPKNPIRHADNPRIS